MAGQFAVHTQQMTLVAATAKTLIELPTNASASLILVGLELGSAASAAGSIVLEWGTYTTTGTGTTVTPAKVGANQGPAANVGTVKINNTAEPAGFAIGTGWSITIPLPGMYSVLYPAGREPYQPISTNRAFRVTSTLASPVRLNVIFEQ